MVQIQAFISITYIEGKNCSFKEQVRQHLLEITKSINFLGRKKKPNKKHYLLEHTVFLQELKNLLYFIFPT